jgi:translation initiation factor 4A
MKVIMDKENIENTTSFDSLNLKDNLLRGIYSYGFENPSKIQSEAIPVLLTGKDVIAQAQSGTGKTGAFLISALEKLDLSKKETQILILAPTHELVHQIYDVAMALSSYLDVTIMEVLGGTSVSECQRGLNANPQIIVGTPGRVLDMIQKKFIFTSTITTLIFDEADETLSYGFKMTIYNIIKTIPTKTQICLFSATIPQELLELSENFMRTPEKILVKKEALTLEGITQFYINIKINDWKYDVLKDLYDTINIAQCIIYINSKNKLMEIYDRLTHDEFPVSYIHGELTSDDRKAVMKEFRSGHSRILLSTDLLSRGIDVQQLSLVINFDLPKSKETYIHRIGRSGRYGRKGVAINLVTDRDLPYMKELEEFYDTNIVEMPQNLEDYLSV